MSENESPLELASENDQEINDLLAEDGNVAHMEFNGTVGYHVHVATGTTDPMAWWKAAFFQALDETILQEVFIDEKDTSAAREQLHAQLRNSFDPITLDYITEKFEDNLEDLIHRSRALGERQSNESLDAFGGDGNE